MLDWYEIVEDYNLKNKVHFVNEKELILELYRSERSCVKVADRIGVSQFPVWQKLRDLKINMSNKKEIRRAAVAGLIILAVILFASLPAAADQKYNPHSGQWETTTQNSELRYNPHSGQWGYSSGTVPRYNPFENQWDMAPPNSELRYNPFDGGSWDHTENHSPEYNPFSGKFEFPFY